MTLYLTDFVVVEIHENIATKRREAAVCRSRTSGEYRSVTCRENV